MILRIGLAVLTLVASVAAELTPPYFNLAEGRKIHATATCGVDYDGPELYCKLVGANTENDNQYYSLIQGQVCDYCDLARPNKTHKAEYAIDGTENWWQSPPLSRGMKYNEVNLTIDFGQEFHVAYLFIRMGNSPRPGLWTLEKSSDYGKTYTSWQHFSDTPSDCESYFGKDSLRPIMRDDDVICTTEYSKIVPLENGEIPVMLLNNRPSANNYFNSTTLQEWTRATNVRIRLLRTKNLLGHLMSVARQDPTVTRRYFYSIKDISIGGRCMCNGHADTCHDLNPQSSTRILTCQCQHNTCGVQCADCCPGFEQKKWRQNTNARPFLCEACNCFGHSNTCEYDEDVDVKGQSLDIHGFYDGGGVCQNCQHNTMGINCNKCKPTFYRPYGRYWNETDVCKPCNCDYFYSTGNCAEETGRCECRPAFSPPNCDSCAYGYFGFPNCRECECNLNGTDGYHCEARDGRCPCKPNYAGDYCKKCTDGYYDFPNCTSCECNFIGSMSDTCQEDTGQCPCKSNYAGKHCNECKDAYYDYPTCLYCNCDNQGTVDEVCDKRSGSCLCREGFGGPRCDQCLPGYYNYPDCIPCNCSSAGSVSTVCDATGKCPCLSNFAGRQCGLCSAGYFQYPECLSCMCDNSGSSAKSCNADGQCPCKSNFDGKTCNQCTEGFYNYPACEECNCDPAGVIAKFAGCGSVPAGELCQCKERVTGRICDKCKPLYWNLNISNPAACEPCDCMLDGTNGAMDTCDLKTGQCVCKPSVLGRTCDQCRDGTFDLFGGSLFGCKDCACDIGGAINSVCDKVSGQCKCHPRISGRTCGYPLTTHYYPTLYQYQYEYEDGSTPFEALVRYQFDENLFPGFSKKGYAVFSPLQNEIINRVHIFKSSVYRVVIRFVNPTQDNIIGQIFIISDNPNEVDQTARVLFKPSHEPQFVTVSGTKGEIPSAVVLDPGSYTIKIKIDKRIYLDYFVLLPAAYYEAPVLTKQIENPCEVGNVALCRHFRYPAILEHSPIYEPFVTDGDKPRNPNEFYNDYEHLAAVQEENLLPMLSQTQPKLNYILSVPTAGPYIIVVDYVTDRSTPEPAFLHVNEVDDPEPDGVATLYPCTYTMICREPVVDRESREKIFFIDPNNLKSIELSVLDEETPPVAIKSITPIAVEQWSTGYINPNPVCVMQDGVCAQGRFAAVPDSKKIEFETDHEDRLAVIQPIDIFDNSTKLVYLDNATASIVITSKVPTPGHYAVLIKFYQPNHPLYNIMYKIDTQGQSYDGKLPIRPCPSNTGCREIIVQDNGMTSFDLEDTFTLTLTNNLLNGVWLDYVLLVPSDQYKNNLLTEETFDQTKEFIKQCGTDHFFIQLNASDFCKQAVFSLTADYNNGALSCSCDIDGSTSLECDPFGGQCQCKPFIIGRQCEACKTGYYGFPECKPCDCPSTALCEKITGECICPPRVTGEKCDQCAAYTFGFDQIIGCEECNCNPLGVERRNLQCDLNNGTCSCRANIVGRICDKCSNGFYGFPHCEQCRCDTRGTTFEICDQVDESCYCKKNVQGRGCDSCVDGTYNLQAANPEGCTKCFCFGKTTRCESAYLRPFNVSMLSNVGISTIIATPTDIEINKWATDSSSIMLNESVAQIDMSFKVDDDGLAYFSMIDYLWNQTNHLSAYGGLLTYNIYYTTGLFGNAQIGPDVILEGENFTIVHQSYEQPANAQKFRGSVRFVETNFRTVSGGPVSREQFMMLLRDLVTIHIRATYWEKTIICKISDVSLTIAHDDDENYHLYEQLAVERCNCPPGYKGDSCEECAQGYYRDPNGPYGGYCLPCQCNGHAKSCDCKTGVCNECDHFTTGLHCEECIEGYYGNSTLGTHHDCMICACPMPIESNNFATSCEVAEDGYKIHCECRAGYTGARCESCAAGFFGQPEVEGDFCKPCDCSGNIDSEPGSCDTVTGECLRCLNNTFGRSCNLCAPGFYGDAIKLKDCQSCICDSVGTEHCDSFIGNCVCHPNVIGEKCDRCEDDHYGFDSGRGCKLCDCAIASYSTQCDGQSGECRCMPGTTGRQCDRCIPGYWNYTADGCVPCSCNTDYSRGLGCNAATGQCECLPGVVGEKCDACPYRWVLIPESGCQECDLCHHGLLDVTDRMLNTLDPVIEEFNTIATGYFTLQKLNYFNDLAEKIGPEVEALDPMRINLNPFSQEVESLEMDINNLDRRVSYAEQNGNDVSVNSYKVLVEADDVLDASRLVNKNVRNTINEVQKLANSFDASETTKVDKAFSEAKSNLKKIEEYVVDDVSGTEQLEKTNKLFKEMEHFSVPIKEQQAQLDTLAEQIKAFDSKLDNIHVLSQTGLNKSLVTDELNAKNKEAFANLKFETVTSQMKNAQKNVDDSKALLENSTALILDLYNNTKEMDRRNFDLKEINERMDNELPKNEDEHRKLLDVIDQAGEHANKLANDADLLDVETSDITANSDTPLKAARAYSNIVDAVRNAREAVKNSKFAAGNATEMCDGIGDRAGQADSIALDLLNDARAALNTVQATLQPHFNRSMNTVQKIADLNQHSDDQVTAIEASLDQIPIDAQTEVWMDARNEATGSLAQAQKALKILEPIRKQISQDVVMARNMPKEVDNTNTDIVQVTAQMERVNDVVPNLKALVDDIGEKQDKINLVVSDMSERIDRVKKQIEMARDIANSVKVGVVFHPNTTLELKAPENLSSQSSTSRVSAYFKTDKPDGFLVYLGNENKSNTKKSKRDDFMAIEIENGYPVLTVDLGNGPERIIHQKPVANGQWHQAIVERTGNNVKFLIREQLEDGTEQLHEASGTIPGPYSVFNVDKDSKIFVGGYPVDYNMQKGVKYSSFEGEIEDLKVGDDEIGLWNFVDGQSNGNGAIERDVLIDRGQPATGYRFSGNGYVILNSKPYVFKQRSSIQFKFRTGRDTQDGLMFYAGKNRHFISIEMRNGAIFFQYKLGQHFVSIGTKAIFNDDQWHKVLAEREGRIGILKVDNKEVYQEETPVGTDENLKISDTMYFGGYPGKINHSEVVNTNFDGCIDDVHIAGTFVDLSQNMKAYGARSGCPSKFSSVLSFAPRQHGFLRKSNVSADNHFQVNLKFKTKQKRGVIFYAANHDQSASIGLTINNGALVLRSMKQELTTGLNKFNNAEWHVVTVTHDGRRLSMVVDESETFDDVYRGANLKIGTGDIYFGGLPKGYRISRGSLPTTAYFVGCISDATVNGQIMNFAESTDRHGLLLENCGRDLLEYDHLSLPIYYPEDDAQPEMDTGSHEDDQLIPDENEIGSDRRAETQAEKEAKKNAAFDENFVENVTEDMQPEEGGEGEEKEIEREREMEREREIERERGRDRESEREREKEEREEDEDVPTTTGTATTSATTATTTVRPAAVATPRATPPKRPRPPPLEETPEPVCKLPVEPEIDVDFDAGYRFGATSSNSRIEFAQIPGKMKKSYDISLQFRTDEPDGILFYAYSQSNDSVALYMQTGLLYHMFKCGQGSAIMISKNVYNDNEWHTVLFSRQQSKGSLMIDDGDTSSAESSVPTRAMTIISPFYVGGVATEAMDVVGANLKIEKGKYFNGCIRGIEFGGRPLGEPSKRVNVMPCSDRVEKGIFYGAGGGYVKLKEKFLVGPEFAITMDIKPRTQNALLLSVHGKKAYLILQLINGTINFSVDNGDGPIVAVFQPTTENFCDGQWRTVKAIKSHYVTTIMVNDISSQPAIGSTNSYVTETSRPLFMGGHPYLTKVRGLTMRRPYLGCIRNVRIRENALAITQNMTFGNVQPGICATN